MERKKPTASAKRSPARPAAKANKPRPQTIKNVLVSNSQRRIRLPLKRIQELVTFLAQREKQTLDQVDIAIVGKQAMARLNEEHLGHAGPTDVLSFNLGEGPAGGLCAQLIVCSDVAIAQARLRGQPAWKELLLYITHGLLHTFGYDDHAPADSRKMHAREDQLLEEFGIGRVYGEKR